jgi:squalene-hopene/tetraprenyl-beta-curcumene cyclase
MTTHMQMRSVFVVALAGGCVLLTSATRSAVEWNPKLAADYLDSRQKEWFAWPRAASPDGPCVSCHTGMPYLLARPALRTLLHESVPTMYETGLRHRLESYAGAEPADGLQRTNAIFVTMFVTEPEKQRQAFDQLWALQKTDGALKGAWQWFAADLDPWETSLEIPYGAALGALAIGSAPASIRDTPDAQARIRSLVTYLNDDLPSRPLHARLALLWASTKLPQVMDAHARQATIDELLAKQQADGGWTLESLGPWTEHPAAPASLTPGASHPYATALTTYVLRLAGDRRVRAKTEHALDWLRAHQDRQTGAWPAVSMNKKYPAGSMEEKFLQDAATAFAVLALTS